MAMSLAKTIELRLPPRVREPFRTALRAASAGWIGALGESLISLVLFGSVARGKATADSDIDLLAVADGLPWSLCDRRKPFLETWARVRREQGLAQVTWNLVVKSRAEGERDMALEPQTGLPLRGAHRAMTAASMGSQYIEEARGRKRIVEMAFRVKLWATVVREAQECVELCLKGALRLVGVEPTKTHDVAEVVQREAARFPDWFRLQVPRLAEISTEMAADRGLASYGDERQQKGPRELFGEQEAARARDNMRLVDGLRDRLRSEVSTRTKQAPRSASETEKVDSPRADEGSQA